MAASPLFCIPFARDLTLWMGAVDASRSSASKVLEKDISVCVYPGGSKEIFKTNPASTVTRLVLKERKGFIKLAIAHGADLVPVFVFGEKYLYSMWRPPRRIWQTLLKTYKVPLIFFWGQFGTWVPYRKSLGVVYGKSIPVQQEDKPSEESVERLHKEYVAAIVTLFEEYKEQFGYDDCETLEIE